MTGLYNRRHFMETVRGRLRPCPAARPALGRADDRCGQLQADQRRAWPRRRATRCSPSWPEACREHVRPGDIVGRYGGDEFIIMVPGITSLRAIQIADQLTRPPTRSRPRRQAAGLHRQHRHRRMPAPRGPAQPAHAGRPGHVRGQAGRRRWLAHFRRGAGTEQAGSRAGGHRAGGQRAGRRRCGGRCKAPELTARPLRRHKQRPLPSRSGPAPVGPGPFRSRVPDAPGRWHGRA